MASNEISNGKVAISATTHIPIAQLNKEISAPETQSIKAVVTLTWPYSSATGSVAFLLAEPNFRLRKSKGQVRVQFSGSSAKSVQQAGIASGDEVILCLDGVEFIHDVVGASTPGRGVEFELKFTERLLLEFRQEMSPDTNLIDIDHPAPEPEVHVSIPSPEIAPAPVTSIYSRVNNDKENGWSSPSFNKRSRTSYGHSPNNQYDPFTDGDEYSLGRARKRTRLSSTWRFSSRSPSPELEEEFGQEIVEDLTSPTDARPSAIIMTDEGCQTLGLEEQDDKETLAQAARQSTNVGTTTRNIEAVNYSPQVEIQIVKSPERREGEVIPPPLQTQLGTPTVDSPQAPSPDNLSALEPPSSLRLLPISSDKLSLVSPIVTAKASPFGNKPAAFGALSDSRQEGFYAADPPGGQGKQSFTDFTNISTSAFGPSKLNDATEQNQDFLDNSSSRWSSVNTQTGRPRSTSPNMTSSYNLLENTLNVEIEHTYAGEENKNTLFEGNDFQEPTTPEARLHYPELTEGEVDEHTFPMSSQHTPHLEYPELHDEQEHAHNPGSTSVSYLEPPDTIEEDSKQPFSVQRYDLSRSQSRAESAVIDLIESDEEEESLGEREVEFEADGEDQLEYDSEDGPEDAPYDDEMAVLGNGGPHEGSEEGSDKDEFRRQEDEIRSRYSSRGVVSVGADQESGEESDAEGEDYDEADRNQTDDYSGDEGFNDEEELGSYDEEEESYDEELPEDDEVITRAPASTAPVFVDLISDDEDEVAEEAALEVDSQISHSGSSSNDQEQHDVDDDEVEASEEEPEQLEVMEDEVSNGSEQFVVEEEDTSMLSERSQLQVTTTVTQSSQDLVPQDPNSLPVSGGLTPKDSSNIDNVTSFPHNAVVEIEETVYQINQTYPTSTEHLESIDLELAASEESQLRGSQGIDYVAADKSIQSGVDNELKLHDEAMNSNRDHLPEPKLYDETVQVEDGVEQEQEPAVKLIVDVDVEESPENELEIQQVATVNTTEHPDSVEDNSIDHKSSPVRAGSRTPPTGPVPPPCHTLDTFGSDGSNDNLAQEHEDLKSPSEQILEDPIQQDATQLPTPANTQVKDLQLSKTSSPDSQDSHKVSRDLKGKEVAAEVATATDTNDQIQAFPEAEDKTERVVINVLETPRTPNKKDNVIVSANPETKVWTSPRRSQRIGRSTEPTSESTEVANQITPLSSRKSVEAEGADDEELSSPIIEDQNTPNNGHDASIEMAMSALDSPTKQTYDLRRREPIVDLKLRLFRNLRTELVDYTALKVIRYHLNKKLDVLAIATTSTPDKNHQSASGLGHWHTTFNITDASIAPSGVTEIQISRPYQEALPIVQAGDGILLRNFVVHASKDRGFILRSEKNEACSWAVFKDEQDKAEMRGPPVEYDDREKNHILAMKEWFRSLDSVATAKLGRANANKAGPSKGTGKAS